MGRIKSNLQGPGTGYSTHPSVTQIHAQKVGVGALILRPVERWLGVLRRSYVPPTKDGRTRDRRMASDLIVTQALLYEVEDLGNGLALVPHEYTNICSSAPRT
jgi:hypothetical protein